MAAAWHLSRRFFGSLLPGGPRREDVRWIESVLSDQELALWSRMYGPDRRHSAAAARGVESLLGVGATKPVVAAALLHDIGKLDSGLRTWGRVVATLSGKVAGHDTAALWRKGSGFTRRVGLYLDHPELGGDMLELAGSDPLTVSWAREHHLSSEDCTIEHSIAEALREVDDD